MIAGVIAEIAILRDNPGSLSWWPPLLAAGGVAAAVGLAVVLAPKARALVVAGAIAMLLLAPGAWAGADARPRDERHVPRRRPRDHRDGRRRPPGGGTPQGGGGGMFGGDTGSLTDAIAYADANGGGAIAVASQSGAAGSLITSGADVVAIGGFSGRESQVTTEWLADAVESGQIRYVLTSGGSGLPNDGRTGADDVMAAVEAVGTPVSSVDGLYDLQGLADALRSQ